MYKESAHLLWYNTMIFHKIKQNNNYLKEVTYQVEEKGLEDLKYI